MRSRSPLRTLLLPFPPALALLVATGDLLPPVRAAEPAAGLAALRALAVADDAKGALESLVTSLGSDQPQSRLVAALSIAALADRTAGADDDTAADFAPAAAALLPLVASDDAALVRAAATALGAIGPVGDDDTIDDCIDALGRAATKAADPDTRAALLVALADYGPAAESAVPTVARILRSKSAIEREAAAAALAAIGPESRQATGELARLLGDSAALVRAAAAAALSAIGPDARDATQALAKVLTDGDTMVRGAAARALAAIGPDAAGATGALVAALGQEKDADVRLGIIDACGEIGPRALPAAPELVKSLGAADAETREAAAAALGELGDGAAAIAAPALETLLADADRFVRVTAVGALSSLGRPAPRARAILLEGLRSDDEDLQAAAAETIGDRGKAATGFGEALAKVAASAKDPHTRAAALAALGSIGSLEQSATLGKALADDDDADVRHAAAWAIAELPDIDPALGGALVAAADDDDVRVRMEVAGILGRLGTPDAKKALASLADDEDDNVSDVAKGVIGGKAAAR